MEPGKVRNINNYGLEAIARQMGFDINGCFLLKDERGLLEETVRSAMRQSDIVAVSGGSSKGKKDETASVIGTPCKRRDPDAGPGIEAGESLRSWDMMCRPERSFWACPGTRPQQ